MNTENIDTLAKTIVPDSDVTNIWWWASIIFAFVIGTIVFIFRHWLKDKLLSVMPLPRVYLSYNGKRAKTITIPLASDFNSNTEYHNRMQHAMEELMQHFPLQDLDVFKNMTLALPGRFQAAQDYNADVQSYLASMKEYYQNTIADQITSEFLYPINLLLYAKGRKACSNLLVTIRTNNNSGAIFAPESVQECKAKVDVAPKQEDYQTSNESGWYFPNDQEEYTYRTWNPKSAAPEYRFKVTQLISGVPDENTIPCFYIDIRKPASYYIEWEINGSEINESGVRGTLVINVK